jgi:hypothetical protein
MEQEKAAKQKEVIGQIDALYRSVESFRNVGRFKKMLRYCACHPNFVPFNAFLLYLQKSTAGYMLPAEDWENNFGRRPKVNARPLFIFVPFKPIQFVYEVKDTEPASAINFSNKNFSKELSRFNKDKIKTPETLYRLLLSNLSKYGIALRDLTQFQSEDSDSVEIEAITVQLNKRKRCDYVSRAIIHVELPAEEQDDVNFFSLCRELAHFFCRHSNIPLLEDLGDRSALDEDIKSFEADTVTWLVCERLGLMSDKKIIYLDKYIDNKLCEIPACSVEEILRAVNEIERMCTNMSFRDGYLYRYDDKFRTLAEEVTMRNRVSSVQLELPLFT